MERRNVYFSTPVWERLKALSAAEETPMADILRRLLSDALGITEDIRVAVEDAADQGDPVPKMRRTLIKEQLERSKLAHTVTRLRVDLDELAAADQARRDVWESMKARVDALHTDTQQHIDATEAALTQLGTAQLVLYRDLKTLQDAEEPRRVGWGQLTESMTTLYDRLEAHVGASQRLMQATAHTLAAQHEGMQDLRRECGALRGGIEQLALVCVDLLRRATATEQGGEPPEEAVHAMARGERWLNALEADILAKSGGADE